MCAFFIGSSLLINFAQSFMPYAVAFVLFAPAENLTTQAHSLTVAFAFDSSACLAAVR